MLVIVLNVPEKQLDVRLLALIMLHYGHIRG